jgi:hypothetical protein
MEAVRTEAIRNTIAYAFKNDGLFDVIRSDESLQKARATLSDKESALLCIREQNSYAAERDDDSADIGHAVEDIIDILDGAHHELLIEEQGVAVQHLNFRYIEIK